MPNHSKIGKFSRSKGRRGEQQLVLHLATLGYKSERILRQYLTPGEADVRAVKGDKIHTFELKSRYSSFKRIYDLYYAERDENTILSFVINADSTPIAVSTDLEKLMDVSSFRNLEKFPPILAYMKDFSRLLKMKELKQSADFLVLKDNNKPRIFIRYWL